MKKISAIVLVLSLLLVLPAAASAEGSAPEQAYDAALEAILGYYSRTGTQELISGPFTDEPGAEARWYILALRQLNTGLDYSGYRKALEAYTAEAGTLSASGRELLALDLLAVGSDSEFITAAAEEAIGAQGLMSYFFGLHLLTNGVACEKFNKEDVVKQLLEMQLADGGWAIMGENGDPDSTAMTIQCLAPYYETDDDVRAAADRGLEFLSAKQLPDGNYKSFGAVNPESASQVVIALASLGIDPLTDERFIKGGNDLLQVLQSYRLEDGTYAHELGGESNGSATMEVFLALTAMKLRQDGLGRLYVFDRELTPEEPAETGSADPGTDIRTILTIVIAAAGLGTALIFFLKGKRNKLSYLMVLLLTGAAIWGVRTIRISSAGNYYGTSETLTGAAASTTITIRCDTVAGQAEHIPADGVVLDTVTVTVPEGASAYDQLVAAARAYEIQLETEGSSRSAYVKGIHYLYEFDFGDLSGWVFEVNGSFASVGCGEYHLKEGDAVRWVYTCDLGKDVGDNFME